MRGFSLIEVLVAMGLLAIGMSGIMALFSTGLAMQKEAVERMDMDILVSGILAQVEEDLAARAAGSGGAASLNGATFAVPGNPTYRYRVFVEDLPDDPAGRVVLCRVQVIARARGRERLYDLGYLPVVPRENQDALIRGLPGR
jgi:prepilin-type N-terminal cleavage/methylation domain-containing protein